MGNRRTDDVGDIIKYQMKARRIDSTVCIKQEELTLQCV